MRLVLDRTPRGWTMDVDGLEDRWELPWPRLDVPVYRDARVGEWSLKSVMLLAAKGYFHTAPVGGVQQATLPRAGVRCWLSG